MQTIGKASSWAKLLYEFIGTAIVVYSYNAVDSANGANSTADRARPLAYFIMWVFAFKVSGAHFNPATSLAVLITERRMKNLLGFFFTFLAQLCGAYLGIAFSYLLIKDYFNNYSLVPSGALYINPTTTDIYWGRLILQETVQTFIFTLAYLIIAFEPSLVKMDRILKGLCMAMVLQACLWMTSGSGGSLNPAFGLAQSTYMVALMNRDGSTAGNDAAIYMWVYIVFPFLGAALAGALFRGHQNMDPHFQTLDGSSRPLSHMLASERADSANDPAAVMARSLHYQQKEPLLASSSPYNFGAADPSKPQQIFISQPQVPEQQNDKQM